MSGVPSNSIPRHSTGDSSSDDNCSLADTKVYRILVTQTIRTRDNCYVFWFSLDQNAEIRDGMVQKANALFCNDDTPTEMCNCEPGWQVGRWTGRQAGRVGKEKKKITETRDT